MIRKDGVLRKIELYQSLMQKETLGDMDPGRAAEHLGRLVELAYGLGQRDGLARALELASGLRTRGGLGPLDEARIHQAEAEAWERLRLLKAGAGSSPWQWEQPELEEELRHLRAALHTGALGEMPGEFLARSLSSTAAIYNHMGRFSEALEHWDGALNVMPSYSLARGSRGYAATHYAHALYDRAQAGLFLMRAGEDLRAALSSGAGERAGAHFKKRLGWITSRLRNQTQEPPGLFRFSEGASADELRYRRWCLEHRLFLNPVNDLGPYPAAARDTISVPPVVRDREGHYQGFFNQLKQAYVSARFLYYEGVVARDAHFADRGVVLFDTMDYPTYSLSSEKVKAAFSIAYSLIGKTAHFINMYMGLGAPPGRVTLRNIWYRGQRMEEGLREEFEERRNWPMRGLFWLGKDFHEDSPGFSEAMEPGARELEDMRHSLEHTYLKLHEGLFGGPSRDTASPPCALRDTMAHSVMRGEFETRTLRLLKTVRAALTYLCLAVHAEEKGARDGETLPALVLNVFDDRWKT